MRGYAKYFGDGTGLCGRLIDADGGHQYGQRELIATLIIGHQRRHWHCGRLRARVAGRYSEWAIASRDEEHIERRVFQSEGDRYTG